MNRNSYSETFASFEQVALHLMIGMPTVSAAEVLTILVWGAWRGLKDKAAPYFYLRSFPQREFLVLGSYSKFVEATTRYSVE